MTLDLPEGHNALLVVLGGHVTVDGGQPVGEAEVLVLRPRRQRSPGFMPMATRCCWC